jgi:hypothetical protein
MNILTEELPDTVEIDGIDYAINTDYRVTLRILMAFEDNELTDYERQVILLSGLYPEVPPNLTGALEKARLFLNGGEISSEDDTPTGPRVYSWEKDANFIYAAFKQTHNIDLQNVKLHWWQFLALFMDLGSDTTFCQLTGLRKRLKTGKATKEERAAAREMGELITVPEPDTRTLEDKEAEADFMALVAKGAKK